jgi:hypothetical protein
MHRPQSLILVLALIALAYVGTITATECTDERVVSCLLTWIDTDHDGNLTAAEFNNYTLYEPCGSDPTHIVGEYIVAACDTNNDNKLSEVDYYAEMGCVRMTAFKNAICMKCDTCEAFNSVE